jgi:hypothetical protein
MDFTSEIEGQRADAVSAQSSVADGSPRHASVRATAVRLFLTCWIVYGIHFATNVVREIYPALALGDHFSFRVDEYANMHPDLFEKPGYGWHIGNNPGVSMLAAIPYAVARPVIDPIVTRVEASRAASGLSDPPSYNSPWPRAQAFYAEAWRRGYDVKFGLATWVMHAFCMAPSSAIGVVAMFYLMLHVFGREKTAICLSILYAFGTPVFLRTGYLNQNLMLGHIVFLGFLVVWNPLSSGRLSTRARYFLGGLAGGTALLFDYSGAVMLGCLGLYGLLKQLRDATRADAVRYSVVFGLGALGPILLLWVYQYQAFGNAFLPGQHWMPPVDWIDLGYQGVSGPQLELLGRLAFDYRFGLFVTCPLFLLAIASPWAYRNVRHRVPPLEFASMLAFFALLWVFFSCVNYTRLQFNTGTRYLAPIFPFLFVPAIVTLMSLPRIVIYLVGILSVLQAWCLAMYRDVERGLGVFEPVLQVMIGGFQLPALSTLSRMGGAYGDYFAHSTPVPLFIVTAAIIYGIWRVPVSRPPRLDITV